MDEDHIFLTATLVTTLLALAMLWPYADAILWAGFTAYFLHYLADRLDAYIKNRTITTAIIILILVGIVASLFYLMLTSIPTVVDIIGRFSEVLSGSVSIFINVFDLPPELAAA
ncbi:MAG: hypothetical protein ABEK12_02130, partial [Candidatus Nanohaloarchaea archaeon]